MAVQLDQRQEWIRTRRQKRKGAKLARLRRQFFRYIILLALLGGGYYGFLHVPWTIADADKDIVVRGNLVASTDQIKSVIADYLDKPIYEMDPKKMESRISTLRAVKYSFVRRYVLPRPKLVIEVLEEYPWATYYKDPEGAPEAIIAQSGRLIPVADFPNIEQPPLKIYGPPNLKLTSTDIDQWASWVAYIGSLTKMPVESVDLRQPNDVRVVDGDLLLKLGTPDTTLGRRLGRLASVMTAIEPLRGKLEYVDLALDNNIPLKVAKKTDLPKRAIN
jgi:cell division septal protein FtsQ